MLTGLRVWWLLHAFTNAYCAKYLLFRRQVENITCMLMFITTVMLIIIHS